MTRAETVTIIELLRRAYPRFIEPSQWEQDLKKVAAGIVDLWADMFAHDPVQLVGAAVRQHIASSKFPPTIAEIRAILMAMTAPLPSPTDVWGEAHRLLNSGIAPDKPEEAYCRMSDACRAAVQAVGGWYALSMATEGDPAIQREFTKAAAAHLAQERAALQGQAPAMLEGSADG